jgi:hypothetical protein
MDSGILASLLTADDQDLTDLVEVYEDPSVPGGGDLVKREYASMECLAEG